MAGRIGRLKDPITGEYKYYDLQTPNTSFRRVASDLKRLGVKNWYFLLEIKDPSLIGVDPHACDKDGHTTLSKDQISRIMTECYRNPWYFLRECARIPDAGGVGVPYKANRGNIAQAFCIYRGYDSWLCLPRQQGKTMSALAFEEWAYIFGTSSSSFIFVNKDGDAAKTNLRRIQNLIEILPEYMRCESVLEADGSRVKSRNSATQMRNAASKNEIVTKAKASSYDAALSIARGLTSA